MHMNMINILQSNKLSYSYIYMCKLFFKNVFICFILQVSTVVYAAVLHPTY